MRDDSYRSDLMLCHLDVFFESEDNYLNGVPYNRFLPDSRGVKDLEKEGCVNRTKKIGQMDTFTITDEGEMFAERLYFSE